MPARPAVSRDAWADAVLDAVAVLRAALAKPRSANAMKAAVAVARLETARGRHNREVAGTEGETVGLTPTARESELA